MKAAEMPVGSVVAGKQSVWIKWLASGQYAEIWRGLEVWTTDRDIDIRLTAGEVAVLRVGMTTPANAIEAARIVQDWGHL